MFCTFFSLKWGISDFLALRAEVRWLKYLANKSLCWGNVDKQLKRWQRSQQQWRWEENIFSLLVSWITENLQTTWIHLLLLTQLAFNQFWLEDTQPHNYFFLLFLIWAVYFQRLRCRLKEPKLCTLGGLSFYLAVCNIYYIILNITDLYLFSFPFSNCTSALPTVQSYHTPACSFSQPHTSWKRTALRGRLFALLWWRKRHKPGRQLAPLLFPPAALGRGSWGSTCPDAEPGGRQREAVSGWQSWSHWTQGSPHLAPLTSPETKRRHRLLNIHAIAFA